MKMVEVQPCARVAVERCAGVRAGERVLVTDAMRDQSVAQALMGAALAANAEAVLTVIPTRRLTPQEPPASVAAAMQATDVVFLYTTYSLTHSSARVRAQQAGARVISMPGVTEDGFLRTLSVDRTGWLLSPTASPIASAGRGRRGSRHPSGRTCGTPWGIR